jgi:cytochrome c
MMQLKCVPGISVHDVHRVVQPRNLSLVASIIFIHQPKEKKMKSVIPSMFVAASLIMAGTALAADMPAAGKAKCGACHDVDKKKMGPSYMDIAKKYKGDADAVGKLDANITKGGSFDWKMGKMPPKGMGASDADIKAMAEYIASLAK